MRRKTISLLSVGLLFLLHCTARGAAPGGPAAWDTYRDTWVGVDGLGRSLPTHQEVGGPRQDRQVGIFY